MNGPDVPAYAQPGDWIAVVVCARCQVRHVRVVRVGAVTTVEEVDHAMSDTWIERPCWRCGRMTLDAYVAGRVSVSKELVRP